MKKRYHVFLPMMSLEEQQKAIRSLRDCDYVYKCETLNFQILSEGEVSKDSENCIRAILLEIEASINIKEQSEECSLKPILHDIFRKTYCIFVSCHTALNARPIKKCIKDLDIVNKFYREGRENINPCALFNHNIIVKNLNLYSTNSCNDKMTTYNDYEVPEFDTLQTTCLKLKIERLKQDLKLLEKEERYEECAKLLRAINMLKSQSIQ